MATENNDLSSYNKDNLPNGEKLKIGIVVSNWNSNITDGLYNGALETLLDLGLLPTNIFKLDVPGSFELIFGAKIIAKNNLDAIICLGSLIKGETPHFDYVCQAVSLGVKISISLCN